MILVLAQEIHDDHTDESKLISMLGLHGENKIKNKAALKQLFFFFFFGDLKINLSI